MVRNAIEHVDEYIDEVANEPLVPWIVDEKFSLKINDGPIRSVKISDLAVEIRCLHGEILNIFL